MIDSSSVGAAPRRLRVFLCHDLRDKKDTVNTFGQPEKGIVLQLSEWLEAHDIDVWRSDKKLTGGETWKRVIYDKAIPTCDLFIVCLTKNFVDETSGQRHREVNRALEIAETKHPDTTFILPIRIEKVYYPRLEDKQYINYYMNQDFDILVPALEKKSQYLVGEKDQEYITKQRVLGSGRSIAGHSPPSVPSSSKRSRLPFFIVVLLLIILLFGGSLSYWVFTSNWPGKSSPKTPTALSSSQQDSILRTYIDDINNLMQKENLKNSQVGSSVRITANTKTQIALKQLNSTRQVELIWFIYRLGLIYVNNTVVDLAGANLEGDDFTHIPQGN